MSKIGKSIKTFLYSKSAPDSLFTYYANRKAAKSRKQLLDLLNSGDDLMDHLSAAQKEHWIPRIDDAVICADNKDIPKDALAGTMVKDHLIMHNGIKIDPLSYYSLPMLKMLMVNKGVHEPQEEKIFQEVLKSLPANRQMTMIELGAYWSFYSMWFQQVHPKTKCYMVEPNRMNLFYGQLNCKLNQFKGTFIHAGIGQRDNPRTNIMAVDTICKRQKIDFIDMLHTDIQGFEFDMLEGCQKMLSEKKVGYLFVSTHSNDLHYNCQRLLSDQYGYTTVASADLDETYCWDGILVMKSPDYPGIEQVSISKKPKRI